MEPIIRQAEPADRAVIERIVHDAYIRHVSRIGRAPAPMNDDYQLHIAEDVVRVNSCELQTTRAAAVRGIPCR